MVSEAGCPPRSGLGFFHICWHCEQKGFQDHIFTKGVLLSFRWSMCWCWMCMTGFCSLIAPAYECKGSCWVFFAVHRNFAFGKHRPEETWIITFQNCQLSLLDLLIENADVPKICAKSFQNKPLFLLAEEENKFLWAHHGAKWLILFPCCPNDFVLIHAMRLLFFSFYLHFIASQ